MNEPAYKELILPSVLVTKADLSRLIREIEDLDNELEAQKARVHTSGDRSDREEKFSYSMPNTSQGLSDFIELNKLDLVDDQQRAHLKRQLKAIKEKAPTMHLTFAVEADIPALRQLAEYIRKEFHPQALLQTGLQPAIVGGVYMRTPNHAYDFTLRSKMAGSRNIIQQDLEQLMHAIPVVEAPTVAEAPQGERAV